MVLTEAKIIRMPQSEKIACMREIEQEMLLLNQHLNDLVYRHRAIFTYDQNIIMDLFVSKYNTRGSACYTASQIAEMINGSQHGFVPQTEKDLEPLVKGGWLIEHKSKYASQFALNTEKVVNNA